MSFDDDQLRTLFQQAADAPDDGAAELDLERIAAAARGELSRAETLEVVDLCAVRPDAAEAWRLAVALQDDATPGEAELPDNVVPLFARPAAWGGLALAAAALLAIGVATLQPGGGEPVYRGGEATEITTAVDDSEVPASEPLTLEWSAPSGARRWRLTVSDAMLRPVHRAEVDRPRAVVPVEVLGAHAGQQLLWRVEGLGDDGAPSMASPTFTVTVGPR
jgi:hypothetical protein